MGEHSEREAEVDPSLLHPSVRFYRGMWRLTQLTDVSVAHPASDAVSSTAAPDRDLPGTTMLSVVALHQQLLPPAPMTGFGEVADENYAAQLATADGIDLLRRNWHLLLALLFPSSRGDGGIIAAAAAAASNSSDAISAKAQVDGGAEEPESTWAPAELYRRVCRPLSEADLKVVREPGHMDRIYYSYIVLLRFFGWRVHDEERGLLDRNRAWTERYALLERFRTNPAGVSNTATSLLASSPLLLSSTPTYAAFNFYEDGLPRVLRGLLDVGFLRLAVRLVEFVMEEIKSGRLVFLLPLVEETLLPLVVSHEHVEESHKARLRKQFYRLTHSDSD